jgi:hypothetical protein
MGRCSWTAARRLGDSHSVPKGLIIAALVLSLAPSLHSQPAQTTLEADVTALANFYDGISNSDKTVIRTWADPATDPCIDGWPGVICNCSQVAPAWTAACLDNLGPSGKSRVVGLDLGAAVTASDEPLEGTISPYIGDLEKLIYLNLAQNQLR